MESETSISGSTNEQWLSCCCVAAFVETALKQLRHQAPERAYLARRLGIRVGPQDTNHWNLPVEPDFNLRGILVAEATKTIPAILEEVSDELGFRHIPFNTIQFGIHAEFFQQAIDQGCVVAIGFDKSRLTKVSMLLRHVARIMPTENPQIVKMLDDSIEPLTPERLEWADLEPAVDNIKDGFWVIGPSEGLVFDLNKSVTWTYVKAKLAEV